MSRFRGSCAESRVAPGTWGMRATTTLPLRSNLEMLQCSSSVCYNEEYVRLYVSIPYHQILDSGASRYERKYFKEVFQGSISRKYGRFIINCMSISICLLIRLIRQDRLRKVYGVYGGKKRTETLKTQADCRLKHSSSFGL